MHVANPFWPKCMDGSIVDPLPIFCKKVCQKYSFCFCLTSYSQHCGQFQDLPPPQQDVGSRLRLERWSWDPWLKIFPGSKVFPAVTQADRQITQIIHRIATTVTIYWASSIPCISNKYSQSFLNFCNDKLNIE